MIYRPPKAPHLRFIALVLLLSVSPFLNAEERIFPLAPPETNTPAATLASFLRYSDAAFAHIQKREGKEAEAHFELAKGCLDLTQLPPRSRKGQGVERALMLKEILDRLPDQQFEVADDPEVSDWVVPGTELHITKVEEGVKKGQFLFSAETVERLPKDFLKVESYPYVREPSSRNFFDWYQKTPGLFDTPPWLRWTSDLPTWASSPIFGQTAWQWAGLILSLLVVLFLSRIALTWASKAGSRRLIGFSRLFFALVVLSIIAFLLSHFIDEQINLTGMPLSVAQFLLEGFAYLALGWAAGDLIMGLSLHSINRTPEDTPHPNASLIRLMALILSVVTGFVIVAYGAEQIGIPVAGIVAGLGVGGLAFGLAAQPTLQNLLGGISLLLDRPVKTGDTCLYAGQKGKVEEIGLRSTRIRNSDRTVTSVPNDSFSRSEITNLSRKDRFLFETTVALRYETSPAMIQEFLEKMRNLLSEDERIGDDFRVCFVSLSDYSIDIGIRCFVQTADANEFFAAQEELLLSIMDLVAETGTDFAFPSMVHYQAEDAGMPNNTKAKSTG